MFNCGSGPALLIGEKKINDNQWHVIAFKRDGSNGELYVDSDPPITGQSGGHTTTINIVSPIFIGGLSSAFTSLATDVIVSWFM